MERMSSHKTQKDNLKKKIKMLETKVELMAFYVPDDKQLEIDKEAYDAVYKIKKIW